MKVTPVISIQELTEQIFAAFASTKTRWWFRGQRCEEWDLYPGVRRGYTRLQERYVTNLFYARAKMRHKYCPASSDYGAWLALMQHYRLPTRLMDWSSSPLVAAYFATKFLFDLARKPDLSDAAIWLLEPHKMNESMGYDPVYPPLNAFSVKPLIIPAFKERKESNIQALAVMPIEDQMRMFVQQGSFTIHTTDDPLNNIPGCEHWLRKLVIPKHAVPGIARELDLLGFRLADIFPDLDNLATEITNMHKPGTGFPS